MCVCMRARACVRACVGVCVCVCVCVCVSLKNKCQRQVHTFHVHKQKDNYNSSNWPVHQLITFTLVYKN